MASNRDIVDVFVAALSPYIGANMASASLRGHCDKLAIDLHAESSEDTIRKLMATVQPGLHVFVGDQKTLQILADIHLRIEALRGAS